LKPLITALDMKNLIQSGEKTIYLDPGTLVTPAARDICNEAGITIEFGTEPHEATCQETTNFLEKTLPAMTALQLNPDLISRIVMEVMAKMPGFGPVLMEKEVDASGIALVKGRSVVCEEFNTGNPRDKVGLTEILTRRESPNMTTGFMTMDHTAFDWHLMYDEIDYVVEGTLDIIVNGKTYRGQAGDVLFIPRDTKITFSTPDKCRFFFVTYPANWDELSGYER